MPACPVTPRLKAPITHVIFDFDGLLVDTEPIYTTANSLMLKRYGAEFTMELKAGQMGMKHLESIEWLLRKVGLNDTVSVEEYALGYEICLHELFPKAAALPGAEKLVRHLADEGVPVAICTGSATKDFEFKSAKHKDWVDLIPLQVLTGDDPSVKRGKPFPDGFRETMKRFPEDQQPASSANVLVFEDAPNGVRAALAAGMNVVMVPAAEFYPSNEFAAGMSQVLHSLEEFRPELYGLPAYSSSS